jgi:hypothetical protein
LFFGKSANKLFDGSIAKGLSGTLLSARISESILCQKAKASKESKSGA